MPISYPTNVWEIFACPQCGGALTRLPDETAACKTCDIHFPTTAWGAFDLRLLKPKHYSLEVIVPASRLPDYHISARPLEVNRHPEVDLSAVPLPYHLSHAVVSHFPRPKGKDSRVLDLGCGDAIHKEICEAAGFTYVGMDIVAENAPLLGDAHAIPFTDESFEFILCMNVLEHIRYPFVMMKEAYRVLKPGGKMIGTVSFMEPFHDYSYYHHSALGTWNTLSYAQFDVEQICPSTEDWSALYAISCMALFPRMPRILAKAIVAPAQMLHRLWYWVGGFISKKATPAVRMQSTSGDFTYIVSKPERA